MPAPQPELLRQSHALLWPCPLSAAAGRFEKRTLLPRLAVVASGVRDKHITSNANTAVRQAGQTCMQNLASIIEKKILSPDPRPGDKELSADGSNRTLQKPSHSHCKVPWKGREERWTVRGLGYAGPLGNTGIRKCIACCQGSGGKRSTYRSWLGTR